MRLCMFHPLDHPMERGWVGRIEGDHVVHLAAQTLQAFFTGGGSAREHAVYPLDGVCLLAPVLHPPAVRVFDEQAAFEFANPAAIRGPGATVGLDGAPLELLPRLALVLGAEGLAGGFTVLGEWRAPGRPKPKDRDFALSLGPVVLAEDAFDGDGTEATVRVGGDERLRARFARFDWERARLLAAEGTALFPGDVLAGPALETVDVASGGPVEIEVPRIGALRARVG